LIVCDLRHNARNLRARKSKHATFAKSAKGPAKR
jgi:hypothetical protein